MNPWDILGWILVAWIGAMVLLKFLIIALDIYEQLSRRVRAYIRHLRTRNTPPAAGQVWYGSDRFSNRYEVTRVHDNGVIGVRCGSASWGDSAAAWRKRVNSSHLYLGRTR